MKTNKDLTLEFDPKGYLQEYYTTIDFENEQLLRFFSNCYQDTPPQSTLLEFGCGPTLYSLITAATKVASISLCDRLEANLREISLWKNGDASAFDWEPFIQRALEIEGLSHVTPQAIAQRTALLRRKLTRFGFCDAFSKPPVLELPDCYDIVQVNFVPESITSSLFQWEMAMHNIFSLLKEGGTFILTALKHATYYQLQQQKFPTVSIDETMLLRIFTQFGFKELNIVMQTIPANPPYRGYTGMIFTRASL